MKNRVPKLYKMPTTTELMPLAKSPLECCTWVNALLAFAPFGLFLLTVSFL